MLFEITVNKIKLVKKNTQIDIMNGVKAMCKVNTRYVVVWENISEDIVRRAAERATVTLGYVSQRNHLVSVGCGWCRLVAVGCGWLVVGALPCEALERSRLGVDAQWYARRLQLLRYELVDLLWGCHVTM